MQPTAPPIRSARRRRSAVALAIALLASVLALTGGGVAPLAAGAQEADPAIAGEPCAPGIGVTVVVDYQQLDGGIEVGCAPGEQADGYAALTNAGFTFNEDGGPVSGTICQIRSKPTEGYPDCWFEGFWGYWKSDGAESWQWSNVGVTAGPLAVDRVEGWSWTSPIPDDYSGEPIRIEVADLPPLLLGDPDCDAGPQLPTFDIVDDDELLPVTIADGYPAEVAVLTDPEADPASATWVETSELALDDHEGEIRVLARRAGTECETSPTFDSVYDVRGAYAPRWNLDDVPGAPSPAVPGTSPDIAGWATGWSSYVPGANVTPNFQTPQGGLGPASSGLVVLGDRGSIDLTFDIAIADGDGYDFAVFENGFAVNGPNEIDFLEVGYIEVSSNGTDFVRFDTASRQETPVGGFQGQRADLLGGMAGKDLAGRGTPFDLSLLRNKDEVRSGVVDLDAITHVRIVDITGDGDDLDSFGRPIYDAHPTTGSAGFDLTGVAVLNQAPRDCTTGPVLPDLGIVDGAEVLPITMADGYPAEVAVLTDLDATPTDDDFEVATEVPLADHVGDTIRIVARAADDSCDEAPTFDAVYDVRGAYAPRWNLDDVPGAPSPAVPGTSPDIAQWASGYENYVVGANVTPNFQTPEGGLGPASSGLVVLGDRGRIDLTFDDLITDGDGYDFAVFENGFAVNGPNEIDFLEVGYVEVSSNGTDFVRFDTASRQETPVGGFQGQRADLLGGMAGKDLAGRGTPFDLTNLRNSPEVRSGAVDLDAITHVRIVDITGDGDDLDSFGRPIYDAHPTTGSAGFDLTGVAALNVIDITAPVVEITSAPDGTVDVGDATIEFTVDDDTATVEYRLDDGDWIEATSPIELEGLADGEHTVAIRAIDPAGNEGTASVTWTVELPVPREVNESFVTAAYTDFLGRAPTAEELAIDAARAGTTVTTRARVVRDLANSDEWIGTIVTGFYQDTLGRNPDPSGLAFWTNQLRTGRRTVAQAGAEFYASNEYFANRGGGTNESWVTDLYQQILDRDPDPAGLAFWVGRAASRGRVHVAYQMYQSPESRRDRVRSLYADLLGRSPDAGGLDYWSRRILAEGDLALATSLASSNEYRNRAVIRFP